MAITVMQFDANAHRQKKCETGHDVANLEDFCPTFLKKPNHKYKRRMPHSRATRASKTSEQLRLRRQHATTTIRGEQSRSDEQHRSWLRNCRRRHSGRAVNIELNARVAEVAVGVEAEGDVAAVADVAGQRGE